MQIARFMHEGKDSFGVVFDDGIHDLGKRHPSRWPDLSTLMTEQDIEVISSIITQERDILISDVTLLPPLQASGRILCVGLNYKAHIAETGRATPDYPVIFPRYADSLVGGNDTILIPNESEQLDFEGELALVIGRGGRRIPQAQALQHVFGYMPFNDGSIRDFQYKTSQFLPGKCFWRSGAAGPFLTTADAAGNPNNLTLQTRLNGNVMQSSNTSDLLFDIAALISVLSTIFPLRPGDIIATGTPGGVGVARKPQLFMRPGDTIEVEISGLGTLRNSVMLEKDYSPARSNNYLQDLHQEY